MSDTFHIPDAAFDAILSADVTGDETLWVARYSFYFSEVTGWPLEDAIRQANAAFAVSGNDSEVTPEEVASSDIHCLMGDG